MGTRQLLCLAAMVGVFGCDFTAPDPPDFSIDVRFSEGTEGWQADIADYPPAGIRRQTASV